MNTSELTGELLDYWVAQAEGIYLIPLMPPRIRIRISDDEFFSVLYSPHKDWSRGGPIIEREMIELSHERDWREDGSFGRVWEASLSVYGYMDGDTPLIAAMRVYVFSKFGNTVPDEVSP